MTDPELKLPLEIFENLPEQPTEEQKRELLLLYGFNDAVVEDPEGGGEQAKGSGKGKDHDKSCCHGHRQPRSCIEYMALAACLSPKELDESRRSGQVCEQVLRHIHLVREKEGLCSRVGSKEERKRKGKSGHNNAFQEAGGLEALMKAYGLDGRKCKTDAKDTGELKQSKTPCSCPCRASRESASKETESRNNIRDKQRTSTKADEDDFELSNAQRQVPGSRVSKSSRSAAYSSEHSSRIASNEIHGDNAQTEDQIPDTQARASTHSRPAAHVQPHARVTNTRTPSQYTTQSSHTTLRPTTSSNRPIIPSLQSVSSFRIPTREAPLGDMQRTYIEGMDICSEYAKDFGRSAQVQSQTGGAEGFGASNRSGKVHSLVASVAGSSGGGNNGGQSFEMSGGRSLGGSAARSSHTPRTSMQTMSSPEIQQAVIESFAKPSQRSPRSSSSASRNAVAQSPISPARSVHGPERLAGINRNELQESWRVPTQQARLGNMERTYIEGMRNTVNMGGAPG